MDPEHTDPAPEPVHDLPDLTTESDDYLAALAEHVACVQEDRRNRAAIPGLVRSLATQWTAGGGDPADLVDAVTRTD